MNGFVGYALNRAPVARWKAWTITTAMVGVAFVVRLALDPIYPYPFLLFIPVVFLSAFLFDRASSLLAAAESALLTWVFFLEPKGILQWPSPGQTLALLLFLAVSGVVGALTEALRLSLEENMRLRGRSDLLLRELNHRVRNDLARVHALVMAQARAKDDPQLRSVADRVSILGQVYGRLHAGNRSATVRIDEFLEELVEELRGAHQDGLPVGLRLHVEPAEVHVGIAADVGLVANELVANAFRYAFPDGRPGTVEVGLRREGDRLVLEVADDGAGFDPGAAPRGTGLGRALVQQLARQHGGTAEVEAAPGAGTRIRVTMRVEE